MSKISTVIANFIRDERGVESTEVGVTTVLLAGGSAANLTDLKDTIQGQVENVSNTVAAVDVS